MLQAKKCMMMVFFLLFVPCIVFAKSANSRTSAVQSAVHVENTDAAKDIFTGVTVYTVDDDEDEEDAFEVALLDAKRDAVEQAGTYIEIMTNMRNYEITTDDVKVLSAAVVKMVPGSIKQQIISEKDGTKTIRLEAKYHVDTKHLEQGLFPGREKDLQLSVRRHNRSIGLESMYNVFKDGRTDYEAYFWFVIMYDIAYKPTSASFHVVFNRTGEQDVPVIMSEKHPVEIQLDYGGNVKTVEFANPTQSSGSRASLTVFSLGLLNVIPKWWGADKVCLEFYQKDGTTYEIVVPRKVLNQWHDMIVNPRKVVAEYEE
ncbi:MAG: hypothetical protein J5477_03430 [Schwartzia sp.]|nr:hypothetical protein [Schwartzia sp. (in: firmicutes)]